MGRRVSEGGGPLTELSRVGGTSSIPGGPGERITRGCCPSRYIYLLGLLLKSHSATSSCLNISKVRENLDRRDSVLGIWLKEERATRKGRTKRMISSFESTSSTVT